MRFLVGVKVTETVVLTASRILIAIGIWITLDPNSFVPVLIPAAFFLSRTVFAVVLPNLADRVSKVALLRALQGAFAVAHVLFFFAAAGAEQHVVLLVSAALLGVVDAYYAPTVNALVPELVSQAQPHSAYRLFLVLGALANTFGLALGFLGYEAVGLLRLFILMSGCPLLAGTVSLRLPPVDGLVAAANRERDASLARLLS